MYDYDDVTMRAFDDELEKIAGLGSFISKGLRGWKNVAKGASKASQGEGKRTWGSHLGTIKKMYQKGAARGDAGVMGGIKNVARSRYGAMAGTAGIGGLAAYGGANMLRGGAKRLSGGSRQPQQQRQY